MCDDTDLINFQLRELRGYFNLRYFLSVTRRSKYRISCTRVQTFKLDSLENEASKPKYIYIYKISSIFFFKFQKTTNYRARIKDHCRSLTQLREFFKKYRQPLRIKVESGKITKFEDKKKMFIFRVKKKCNLFFPRKKNLQFLPTCLLVIITLSTSTTPIHPNFPSITKLITLPAHTYTHTRGWK